MEAYLFTLVVLGLMASGHTAAGGTMLRNAGVSEPLHALAMAAIYAPSAAREEELPFRIAQRLADAQRVAGTSTAPQHAPPPAGGRTTAPMLQTAPASINVEGMPAGDARVSGAVGEIEYVQVANALITVYRKHDGAKMLGPVQANAMFAGAPSSAGARACAAPRDGDTAVMFDQFARRWILSHRAWAPGHAGTGPYYLCIAVSATPDATGSYHRHVHAVYGAAGQPLYFDDPQLALWPDAYYFSASLFDGAAGRYLGPRVCGLDRQALLRGFDARIRCRDLGAAAGPLVVAGVEGYAGPSHVSGAALFLAPDLSPEGHGAHLLLWRYSYGADRLDGPLAIPVAPFTIACAAGDACVEQPAPGARLAAAGERLMPHPVYRNDYGRDSLVVSHSVQMPEGQLGVRWYEIDTPFGAARAYQQGNFAPDGASRWSGSIGMDKAGNIALGYRVASSDTAPGIRYSGRERTDPPGRMRAEHIVFNGAGVEPRAGLVSARLHAGALTLDPVDGCTFWYTQQYLPSTGPANWRTRVASFAFESCR